MSEVADWSLTYEHFIFFACAVAIACIFQLLMMGYHLYMVYKNEFATHSKPTNNKSKSLLYKITTYLTIIFMLSYFTCQSSAWIQVWNCIGFGADILGWSCLLYQIAKGIMYIIFLIRLHMVYSASAYAYNPKILIISSILIMIAQIVTGIYGSVTYIKIVYSVNIFNRKIITCSTTLDLWFMIILIPLDGTITLVLLAAFIVPLYKILKSLKNQRKGKQS